MSTAAARSPQLTFTEQVAALPDCAERLQVAERAAWEAYALADLLQLQIAANPDSLNELAVHGVAARIKSLVSVVSTVVGDPEEPLSGDFVKGLLNGPDRTA